MSPPRLASRLHCSSEAPRKSSLPPFFFPTITLNEFSKSPRHRRPQDEQELRQHDQPLRCRTSATPKTQDNGHRSRRVRLTDPGNPDICPVYDFHKIYSPPPVIERVNKECRTAEIGCIDWGEQKGDRLLFVMSPSALVLIIRPRIPRGPAPFWCIRLDSCRHHAWPRGFTAAARPPRKSSLSLFFSPG
jgi:hypothetical protein